jgi:hypothetical protein
MNRISRHVKYVDSRDTYPKSTFLLSIGPKSQIVRLIQQLALGYPIRNEYEWLFLMLLVFFDDIDSR